MILMMKCDSQMPALMPNAIDAKNRFGDHRRVDDRLGFLFNDRKRQSCSNAAKALATVSVNLRVVFVGRLNQVWVMMVVSIFHHSHN